MNMSEKKKVVAKQNFVWNSRNKSDQKTSKKTAWEQRANEYG